MYRQLIKENTGVEENEFVPGYSHNDGLRFDENDEVHKMMDSMKLFLRFLSRCQIKYPLF